jgi:hypothetical protein
MDEAQLPDLLSILLEPLDLSILQIVSCQGSLCIIKAANAKYAVKLVPLHSVSRVQDILDHVNSINLQEVLIVKPLHERALISTKYTGIAYLFVPGDTFDKVQSIDKLTVFARTVGNFSRVASRVTTGNLAPFELAMIPQPTTVWGVEHAVQLLQHMKDPELASIALLMTESLRFLTGCPLKGYARVQLTYGDLHYKNVIWDSTSQHPTIIDLDSLGFLLQ